MPYFHLKGKLPREEVGASLFTILQIYFLSKNNLFNLIIVR